MSEQSPSIMTPESFGLDSLGSFDEIAPQEADAAATASDPLSIFNGYLGVFVAAFLVTLIAAPIMRRLAIANGVVDLPADGRKEHPLPVAYLGGAAVFLGLLAGIAYSYFAPLTSLPLIEFHASEVNLRPVPISVLLGLTLIMLAGLLDDVVGVSPRIKISGQLLAAAALAMDDVGVKVAAGVLKPIGSLIGNQELFYTIDLPFTIPGLGAELPIDIIYWTGTAIIAVFILGACNASNLMDGLDGLLTGVTAIAAGALLLISLGLAAASDGPLDASRVILCLALLGACLGFLPHNFNPATIFLGDSGSLLLGFLTIVLILSLGDTGKTQLVVAGLIIYSLPIIDTTLAIVRRRMSGRPMSEPDNEHIHHLLRRSMDVKKAVFVLYGIAAVFGGLGVLISEGRARVAYVAAMVIAAFIGVTAVKIARRRALELQAEAIIEARTRPADARSASKAPTQAPSASPPTGPTSPQPGKA